MIEKRNYAGLSLDPVPTKYVLLYVLTRRYTTVRLDIIFRLYD